MQSLRYLDAPFTRHSAAAELAVEIIAQLGYGLVAAISRTC